MLRWLDTVDEFKSDKVLTEYPAKIVDAYWFIKHERQSIRHAKDVDAQNDQKSKPTFGGF